MIGHVVVRATGDQFAGCSSVKASDLCPEIFGYCRGVETLDGATGTAKRAKLNHRQFVFLGNIGKRFFILERLGEFFTCFIKQLDALGLFVVLGDRQFHLGERTIPCRGDFLEGCDKIRVSIAGSAQAGGSINKGICDAQGKNFRRSDPLQSGNKWQVAAHWRCCADFQILQQRHLLQSVEFRLGVVG